jgi:hypothetical protein
MGDIFKVDDNGNLSLTMRGVDPIKPRKYATVSEAVDAERCAMNYILFVDEGEFYVDNVWHVIARRGTRRVLGDVLQEEGHL